MVFIFLWWILPCSDLFHHLILTYWSKIMCKVHHSISFDGDTEKKKSWFILAERKKKLRQLHTEFHQFNWMKCASIAIDVRVQYTEQTIIYILYVHNSQYAYKSYDLVIVLFAMALPLERIKCDIESTVLRTCHFLKAKANHRSTRQTKIYV